MVEWLMVNGEWLNSLMVEWLMVEWSLVNG